MLIKLESVSTVIAVFQAGLKKVVGIVDMCCMRYAERTNVESVEQLTSDKNFTLEKLFLKRAERDFRVARWPCYSDKIAMSLRAASENINKAKDFFESLKYYLRM